MRRIIWSGEARRDLMAIAEHYRSIDPDLARQILRSVQQAPLILLDHPGIGEMTDRPSLRKWRVKGTPFLLFYAASRERVEIMRVRHAAEDWRKS